MHHLLRSYDLRRLISSSFIWFNSFFSCCWTLAVPDLCTHISINTADRKHPSKPILTSVVTLRKPFSVGVDFQVPSCRDPSSWEHAPHGGTHYHPDHPIRIRVTRLSYPDCLKEAQTTLINIRHPDDFHLISGPPQGSSNDTCKNRTFGRLPQMHSDDQHKPSEYNCLDHWLK